MTPDHTIGEKEPVWREWWRRMQTKFALPIMTVDQTESQEPA